MFQDCCKMMFSEHEEAVAQMNSVYLVACTRPVYDEDSQYSSMARGRESL